MTGTTQAVTGNPNFPQAPAQKRQGADALETAFLEQMLKYMGPKARQGAGSGGDAEAQFQSFLSQQYARILAERIDLRLTQGGR